MNYLKTASVRALMEALEQIHSVTDVSIYAETVFAAVNNLVPGALFSFDQIDLRTGEVKHALSQPSLTSEELKRKIIELIPSNPVVPAMQAGLRGAISVTDCITHRQWRDTAHYVELMVPLGLRYETVVILDIPGKIAGITVNRDKKFTETEATLIRLLAPHTALAHRIAQLITSLNQARAQTIPAPHDLQQLGLTAREGRCCTGLCKGSGIARSAQFCQPAREQFRNISAAFFRN